MNKEENVFARWSRRKQQTEKQTLQEDAAIDLSTLDAVQETPSDTPGVCCDQNLKPDEVEPLLTDADMPDIETLHEDSDFSGFMSSGVSDELRNLALRKLFKAPGFNIRDGLDEYDEDYTSFEKLGDIITCDMKHQLEMEAEKLRQKEQEALTTEEAEEITETEVAKLDEQVQGHSEDEHLLSEGSDNLNDTQQDSADMPTQDEALYNTGDRT